MKKIWICSILSILCFIGSATFALGKQTFADELSYVVFDQSYDRLKAVDTQAKELYELGKINHKQAVFHAVQKLKRQLHDDQVKRYGTPNGWKQVESNIAAIEQAILNDSPAEHWLEPMNSVVLAIDALMQSEHGPWLQYEALLLDDLKQVKQATKRLDGNRSEAAAGMLTMMKLRVERMEPAVYMVGDELRMDELSARIDQLHTFFRDTIGNPWTSKQEEVLELSLAGIEYTIHQVFKQSEQTLTIPIELSPNQFVPIYMALLLGAFIFSLLAYSGWRKYKQTPYGIKPLE